MDQSLSVKLVDNNMSFFILKQKLWFTKFHWFVTSNNYVLLSKQAFCEDKNFTVCHSSAWASKMVTSAYWVYANQV